MIETIKIPVKSLDFLLDCNIADKNATTDKLRGRKSIPNESLVVVENKDNFWRFL